MIGNTTIHHFEVFCEVVRCGNMSRASENLFLAQSSVSKIISELENYYNTCLFERFPKKLHLTASGEELYRYAEKMLEMYDETNLHMKDFCNPRVLRIGASPTAGAYYVLFLVAEFKRQISDVRPEVFVYSTQNLQKRIANHELDLAICDVPIDIQGVIRIPILADTLIFVCGRDYPLAQKTDLVPSDLNGHSFIFRENASGTKRILDRYLKKYNLDVQVSWICNNVEAIKKAALYNEGIALVSKIAVTEEIKNGFLVELPLYDDILVRTFSVIYSKNKYLSGAMKSFMEICGIKEERE